MRCVILHQSDKRIRVKTPLINMSLRQADLLEYYLLNISGIKEAKVDERTGNATVFFVKSGKGNADILREALLKFNENDESVTSLVPEESGRKLSREYQEKLTFQVIKHLFSKIFLPAPIRAGRTVVKSLPFVVKAIRSLAGGKIKVDLLDGIAITASVLRNDYDTASSIIFLLETGEILEEWTRKKSIGDLARSMSLNVDNVWLKKDGAEILVPVSSVQAGDHIVIRTSDIIPLDGKVIDGMVTVNQSVLTGESEPVIKDADNFVFAGTVVEEGECTVEVTEASGRGKYDQIVRMIEESEKLKSDTEAKAYRLADSLVPYSFAGFAATYALTRNMAKALSFLMVDYSCAMKLSMPLAVLSAIKEAREYGISVKGGKFMELAAEADTIIFDKTGTLTYAAPELVKIVTFGGNDPDEMLRIAACLEEHYPHSVANAIVNGALDRGLNHEELHSKVEYIVAHGVSSYIGDKKVVIGSSHFVLEDERCIIPEGEEYRLEKVEKEYSRIYLAINGVLVAVLCISDPPRKEAPAVIAELHNLGFTNICMMTGDNRITAKAVADKLGIDEYMAEVLPEGKAAFAKEKKLQGHKVIMVGDGVNDSPALSEADVGIAVESGAAIAREIADITISSNDLNAIVTLRKLSSLLMQRIRHNYRFIVGFNSTLIGLGLGGIISPSSSALLHNGSTILTGIRSTNRLIERQ